MVPHKDTKLLLSLMIKEETLLERVEAGVKNTIEEEIMIQGEVMIHITSMRKEITGVEMTHHHIDIMMTRSDMIIGKRVAPGLTIGEILHKIIIEIIVEKVMKQNMSREINLTKEIARIRNKDLINMVVIIDQDTKVDLVDLGMIEETIEEMIEELIEGMIDITTMVVVVTEVEETLEEAEEEVTSGEIEEDSEVEEMSMIPRLIIMLSLWPQVKKLY